MTTEALTTAAIRRFVDDLVPAVLRAMVANSPRGRVTRERAYEQVEALIRLLEPNPISTTEIPTAAAASVIAEVRVAVTLHLLAHRESLTGGRLSSWASWARYGGGCSHAMRNALDDGGWDTASEIVRVPTRDEMVEYLFSNAHDLVCNGRAEWLGVEVVWDGDATMPTDYAIDLIAGEAILQACDDLAFMAGRRSRKVIDEALACREVAFLEMAREGVS